MPIKWTQPALADLIEAQSFIAQENPQAARLIAQRVWNATELLGEQPHMGRIGHVAGTREWLVNKRPLPNRLSHSGSMD